MESDMGRCISRPMPSVDPFSANCCWGRHFLFVIVSLGQEITIRQVKKTVSTVCNSTVHSGCFRQLHTHKSEKEIIYLDSAETERLPSCPGNTDLIASLCCKGPGVT